LLRQLAAFAHEPAHVFGPLVPGKQRRWIRIALASLAGKSAPALPATDVHGRKPWPVMPCKRIRCRLCSKVNTEIATPQDE
jgi:hypothetical protein